MERGIFVYNFQKIIYELNALYACVDYLCNEFLMLLLLYMKKLTGPSKLCFVKIIKLTRTKILYSTIIMQLFATLIKFWTNFISCFFTPWSKTLNKKMIKS